MNAIFQIGSSSCQWNETPEQFARSIRFCETIARSIRHKGWFTDEDQDETARGVVFAISHGRFMAGITDPCNFDEKSVSGPCVVCVDEVFDSETDAALRADRLAELYAEDERENDAEYRRQQEEEAAALESAEANYWKERGVVTV